MKFKNFLLERIPGKSYDFASTQIDLDIYNSKQIYDFGLDNVTPQMLDPIDGRQAENDVHLTVLYGLHANDYKEVEPFVKAFGPFEIELGQLSLFKGDDKDVLKIEVKENFALHQMHKFLKVNCENSYKFPEYNSHITIAYCRPGVVNHLVGNKTFDGVKIFVHRVTFSSKDGVKTQIHLYGSKNVSKYGQV